MTTIDDAYSMLEQKFSRDEDKPETVVYWPVNETGSVTISRLEWNTNGTEHRRRQLLKAKHRWAGDLAEG